MNTTWRLRSPKFGDYIEDQSDKEREDMGSEDEEEYEIWWPNNLLKLLTVTRLKY